MSSQAHDIHNAYMEFAIHVESMGEWAESHFPEYTQFIFLCKKTAERARSDAENALVIYNIKGTK